MKFDQHQPVRPIPFNMLTRALMASETNAGPRFESTLLSTGRRPLVSRQFIDSFRYSFLLIESIYGAGRFKKEALKASLKGNQAFTALVTNVIRNYEKPHNAQSSPTAKMLESGPSPSDVIEHIVEMRGLYFHGNVLRSNAWRPEEQGLAQELALLTISIAQAIANDSAKAMFDPVFDIRHTAEAFAAGAQTMLQIDFVYLNHPNDVATPHQLNIQAPATKATKNAWSSMPQNHDEAF